MTRDATIEKWATVWPQVKPEQTLVVLREARARRQYLEALCGLLRAGERLAAAEDLLEVDVALVRAIA